MLLRFNSGMKLVAWITLGFASYCVCQSSPQLPMPALTQAPAPSPLAGAITEQPPGLPPAGSISGTVVDQSGAVIAGARVDLLAQNQSLKQEALSGPDGQFSFTNVSPGTFSLTIASAGFGMGAFSGVLHPGEIETIPQIVLPVAEDLTEVRVGVTQVEVAEDQIKVEEKQRVLGAIPNFYVSYIPNPAPLTAKQKFKLAWKTVVDPFTFAVVAGTAGMEQAQNHFDEYGQGTEGYAKRFGAGYADTAAGTFIGSAILPALLKQDPRYFYKGHGTPPSRFLYAIANALICKGDNGHWQPNYSNVLGNLAAGGISNLYYPANDRNGAELTFENGGIGIGTTAATNVLQEFFIRKLTPRERHHKTQDGM